MFMYAHAHVRVSQLQRTIYPCRDSFRLFRDSRSFPMYIVISPCTIMYRNCFYCFYCASCGSAPVTNARGARGCSAPSFYEGMVVGARHLVEWLEGTGDRFCGSLPRTSVPAGTRTRSRKHLCFCVSCFCLLCFLIFFASSRRAPEPDGALRFRRADPSRMAQQTTEVK